MAGKKPPRRRSTVVKKGSYLLNGKTPDKELLYTDILIRTKYNIENKG